MSNLDRLLAITHAVQHDLNGQRWDMSAWQWNHNWKGVVFGGSEAFSVLCFV